MTTNLKRDDYTVGWICALPIELKAVLEILDETHPVIDVPAEDTSVYKFGRMGRHNVVISCLSEYGTTRAAVAATWMRSTFKRLRFGLMVGVGGGAPSCENDVRLGDIVISEPTGKSGGVIQYDFGKAMENGEFIQTGLLNAPPPILRNAISAIKAIDKAELGKRISIIAQDIEDTTTAFYYPGQDTDRLFRADYSHVASEGRRRETCASCEVADVNLVTRSERQYDHPYIHYGTIASANQVMKDAIKRDTIRAQTECLCFEMEAAGLMNDFPCLVVRGISDYSDSHKNKRWQPYAALVAAIYAKELLLQIPAASKDDTETDDATSVDWECLQTLYTSDYESHKNRNPTREKGTCEWFLKHEKYKIWQQGQQSCFLWISGNPGCGKSVLSSFLVDGLCGEGSETVCYFFFKDDNDIQKSATHALCALLHQLFKAKRSLIRYAGADFKDKGRKFTLEFNSLWKILLAATASSDCGTVICVLDGLDECEDKSRELLLKSLTKYYSGYGEANSSEGSLKFIVTSRPVVFIERELHRDQIIRLKTENESSSTNEDIERVVKAKMKRIGAIRGLSYAVQAGLEEFLIKNADQTFLWVSMILGIIENSPRASERSLNNIIGTIPPTLGAVYDKILENSPNLEDTRKLLHIIVGATRPLTLEEMNTAFNIKPGDESYKDIDREPEIDGMIKSLCGSFVRVIDSKIYLVHQTAKEYLINNPALATSMTGRWKNSLDPVESNRILAEICIAHLLLDEFEFKLLQWEIDVFSLGYASLSRFIAYALGHVFLGYAASNWATHFRIAEKKEDRTLLNSAFRLYDNQSRRIVAMWKHWIASSRTFVSPGDKPHQFTSLMMASLFGHTSVARLLLVEKGVNITARDGKGQTALHWAAGQGNDAIAQLLIYHGAQIEARDDSQRTALYHAVECRHFAVTKVLVEGNADINATRGTNNILCTAVAVLSNIRMRGILRLANGTIWYPEKLYNGKNTKIVRLLIEKGVDVNPRNSDPLMSQSAALHRAVLTNQQEMVQLLLDAGADVNIESYPNSGYRPGTALMIAARFATKEIVEILLDNGADISLHDGRGMTALHWAVVLKANRKDQREIVHMLVTKGAYVNATDNDGETPLHRALDKSSIQLLMDLGASIDVANKRGETPLHLRVLRKDNPAIQLLLDLGACVNAKDNHGTTPLHQAQDEFAVQLLLNYGADVEAKDRFGWTALHYFVNNGWETAVQLLLKNGAHYTKVDFEYTYPAPMLTAERHNSDLSLRQVETTLASEIAIDCVFNDSYYLALDMDINSFS